jgi:phospholipid/cholesterol/gamma-HCH transport system ATP-binding protein
VTAQGAPGPVVVLEHVSKAFGDHVVLEDVSFEIPRGCAFCLLGRSGTGKSVTLKHVIGLVKPDRGSVMVEGREVPALPRAELNDLRKRIGFLFQDAALFDSITVGENVAFPLRRHTRLPEAQIRERAAAALGDVGLGDQYDKMPGALSGGMRKRAGLARAMVLEPALLLADEPSAGLDPITAGEIDELLIEQKRQHRVTLLVVTHNIPSARAIGDELAVLDHGRLVARGTPRELDQSAVPLVRAFMRGGSGG